VALLMRWLREDILSLAGPEEATRRALFAFVIAERRARQALCPQRIKEVGKMLENQRQALLAFAVPLDEALASVAAKGAVPVATVRQRLGVQRLSAKNPRRWSQEALLRQQLPERYHELSRAGAEVARRVVRASSVAENLNRRLRCYFFLRRELGQDYLSLLQFFLNHRRFQRNAPTERKDKSPAELRTGQPHPHWLEMLGYQRFQRNGQRAKSELPQTAPNRRARTGSVVSPKTDHF